MMGITGAFSSLGINENARRRLDTSPGPSGLNYSTMSLPNLVSLEKRTATGFKNLTNYNSCICDDEIDAGDQPIDFSKKYAETKISSDKDTKGTHKSSDNRHCTYNKVVKTYPGNFTMYAETDLDQPTDYSLRYAEDDSEPDESIAIPKTEFVQDTIKTYCTEDTPYETPFNFSTSTSMSDLRIDDKVATEKTITEDKRTAPEVIVIADVVEAEQKAKVVKSGFSSGLMSPEKPVNYCDEGTPGYFSRVDSCGSLNYIPVDGVKQEPKEIVKIDEKEQTRTKLKFPAEAKAVKFEDVVNYAEETPLMFSRSSSLASLDSIEQHSIQDDRSSVVSDFSRLTSGVISPSELPDSPTQTVPPSPKSRKSKLLFPPLPPENPAEEDAAPPCEELLPKPCIFEDVVKSFQMESTPIQYSTATSLSSLLIDDRDESDTKSPDLEPIKDPALDLNNDLSESSEDEDILAACINIGMQNNRYSQAKSQTPPPAFNASDLSGSASHSGFNLIGAQGSSRQCEKNGAKSEFNNWDSIRSYCTEDTPAILSNAGSQSDLSVLSMSCTEDRLLNRTVVERIREERANNKCAASDSAYLIFPSSKTYTSEQPEENNSRHSSLSMLSDDSYESEQALLQECILAGMPRTVNVPSEKETDQNLLQQCILEGIMKNMSISKEDTNLLPKEQILKTNKIDVEDDDDDADLLQQCIISGMLKSAKIPANPHDSDMSEAEQALLNQCDLAGMYKKTIRTKKSPSFEQHRKPFSIESDTSDDNDDDDDILANCINMGMQTKMYSSQSSRPQYQYHQPNVKSVNPKLTSVNDSVQSYFTEDTPAIMSHAGSNSDLSVLSGTENDIVKDYLSDVLSNETDEDDERLLQECVKFGMAKTLGTNRFDHSKGTLERSSVVENDLRGPSSSRTKRKVNLNLNISLESNASDDDPFPISDEESEKALLQECILSGMPKSTNPPSHPRPRPPLRDTPDLSESEKTLLEQCILQGMRNCRLTSKKSPDIETNELTAAEQSLLRQCILSGMPKNKNLMLGGPSALRESSDLTDSEKLLLQQCIMAGMPSKGRGHSNATNGKAGSSKQWMRRPREAERGAQEVQHGCCVHCPRNNQMNSKSVPKTGNLKVKKKSKGPVRNRDISILYMTSQILAVRKERVDRSHEEWI